ncbi:hypothetical protein DL96DRAFT_1715762 [Flagelloscypha sp. PMI_526]|nr:hypothetical protein DL96DRAFT_1715762 [Flagelloscypha sp. PMI_526]
MSSDSDSDTPEPQTRAKRTRDTPEPQRGTKRTRKSVGRDVRAMIRILRVYQLQTGALIEELTKYTGGHEYGQSSICRVLSNHHKDNTGDNEWKFVSARFKATWPQLPKSYCYKDKRPIWRSTGKIFAPVDDHTTASLLRIARRRGRCVDRFPKPVKNKQAATSSSAPKSLPKPSIKRQSTVSTSESETGGEIESGSESDCESDSETDSEIGLDSDDEPPRKKIKLDPSSRTPQEQPKRNNNYLHPEPLNPPPDTVSSSSRRTRSPDATPPIAGLEREARTFYESFPTDMTPYYQDLVDSDLGNMKQLTYWSKQPEEKIAKLFKEMLPDLPPGKLYMLVDFVGELNC